MGEKRIVPDCVRSWSKGEVVEIRSPKATRPWQHVLEPLSGYLLLGKQLSERSSLSGESFNFGPRAEVVATVESLVNEMNRHWSLAKWKDVGGQNQANNEAGLLKLCCDKALHHLEWQAILNFEETIEMTSSWYSHFYDNNGMVNTENDIKKYQSLARERGAVWTN